jgi:diacylglycerol kinase (ATP)
MRLGVISNPDSYRNLRDAGEVRSFIRKRAEVVHFDAHNPGEMFDVMPEFARAETDVLVINGGDGTVGAALTAVLRDGVFEKRPRLAVVPAGRTNAIAHDVGQTGSQRRVLARLIEAASGDRPVRSVARPVLRVDLGESRDPLYGMFLGGAAFYDWVRLARKTLQRLRVTRSSLVGLAMAQLCFKYLTGGRGDTRLFSPTKIGISVNGRAEPVRDYVLVLATTLRRLPASLSPFWGSGGGTLRYTWVTYPPQRPVRGAILTMLGRPRPWMAEAGFSSGSANRLELSLSRRLVLDGEFVEPPSGEALRVSADNVVSFIQC